MGPHTLRLAQGADLAAVGSLVAEVCRGAEAHCIHSWSGETAAECAAELADAMVRGELIYALAEMQGRLVGAMGCELDHELGRGWLHGPHADSATHWNTVAEAVHSLLRDELPKGITDLAAFLNVANERAITFYARHGFDEQPTRHHEYLLSADAAPARVARPRLEAPHRRAFTALYAALFPNSYYSGDRLLAMQGRSHEIFVSTSGDQVDGFCVPCLSADRRRGEIQFLGVREDARRRGIGRCLLEAGVSWLRDSGALAIALNVADTGAGARRLYEQAGFELRYTGLGLRWSPSAG